MKEDVSSTHTPRLGSVDTDQCDNDDAPRPFSDLPPEVQALLIQRKKDDAPKNPIELLEGKHVMECILYIEATQPVLKSDIYANVTRAQSMAKKLDDLRRFGLIEIYQTARFNSNVIVLTKKGERTAEAIRQMLSIADGSSEAYYRCRRRRRYRGVSRSFKNRKSLDRHI